MGEREAVERRQGAAPAERAEGRAASGHEPLGPEALAPWQAALGPRPPAGLLAPPIQAKLEVGAADDPLECEADAVAEAALSGGEAAPLSRDGAPALRRAPGEVTQANQFHLTLFLSSYEGGPLVPPAATQAFLANPATLALNQRLRDAVLANRRAGRPPLTINQFYNLALTITSHGGTALLLCHNVAKAFARGSGALAVQPLGDGEFFALFSRTDLGASDSGDWYHYFVVSLPAYYRTAGALDASIPPGPTDEGLGTSMRRGVATGLVTTLRDKLRDPAVPSSPAYEGWLEANAISFAEGATFGHSLSEVLGESLVHLYGAQTGVSVAGGQVAESWPWYVPLPRGIVDGDSPNLERFTQNFGRLQNEGVLIFTYRIYTIQGRMLREVRTSVPPPPAPATPEPAPTPPPSPPPSSGGRGGGILRKAAGPAPAIAPPSVRRALAGSGQPLDGASRAFMEPRLGADLGHVRVHTDAAAGASAREIGALAYTYGSHVVFAPGEHQPATTAGRRLLAHELAHVVQQSPPAVRRQSHPEEGAGPACHTGYQEGQGTVMPLGPELAALVDPPGQTQIYVIWGTWRAGDTSESYSNRIYPLWIRWRFGSVDARAQAEMIRLLNTSPYTQFELAPSPDCQYGIAVSMVLLNQITTVARRAQGAAAEARERAATVQQPPPVAVVRDAPQGQAPQQQPTPEQQPSPEQRAPVPRTGSEFEGATDRRANAPALPANIVGPDRQVTGGTGTYTMRLEYWPAGATRLAQVVEAMNWVSYHWEIYNITPLVKRGLAEQAQAQLRHAAGSAEAAVGPLAATGRSAERRAADLAEDARNAANDLLHPVESTSEGTPGQVLTNLIANYGNLTLLQVSVITSAGGFSVGALADLMGGTFQEREIPWPLESGYYFVRCLATPSPQGPNGEQQRATSVATKVVELRSTQVRARDALGDPEANLAETDLALAQERDPERRRELELLRAEQEAQASGSATRVIELAIQRVDRQLATAVGFTRTQLLEQRDALNRRLELARGRWSVAVGPETRVYRPRAVLVSEVTGESYPLLVQFIELPAPEPGTHRVQLSDITSQDGRVYTGRGPTLLDAAWLAMVDLVGASGFGRGYVAVRMPAEIPGARREDLLRSAPRGPTQTQERLNDLVTVLTILALFVPGVGQVAAVVGAAVAAARLYDRWANRTLRFDMAAVNDTISVLGAAAQGVAAIGRLRQVRAAGRFALIDAADEAAFLRAEQSLASALALTGRAERVARLIDLGGLMVGNLDTLEQIVRLNAAELAGTISHSEARRQRANLLLGAIQQNAIEFIEPRRTRELGPEGVTATPPPHEGAAPTPREQAAPTPREQAAPTPHAQQEGGGTADPTPVRPGDPGSTEHPPPEGDRRVRAFATTPDGRHAVTILVGGPIVRCQTCATIRNHYAEFLGAQTDAARTADPDIRNRADALVQRLDALTAQSDQNERDLQVLAAHEADGPLTESQRQTRERLQQDQQAIATAVAALDVDIRRFAAERLVAGTRVTGRNAQARVEVLLETLTPEAVQDLAVQLGAENFRLLVGVSGDPAREAQTQGIVRQFGRVWNLSNGDPVMRRTLIELMPARGAAANKLQALTNVGNLMERYPGRVHGELVMRYLAAAAEGRVGDANAEVRLAEDILAGRTPFGAGQAVEGLVTSNVEGERTPEYRVVAPDGTARLAESKHLAQLEAEAIQRNLSSAVGQIIQHAQRSAMERGGYVRLDASESVTAMTPAEILNRVNGVMNPTSTRGAQQPADTGGAALGVTPDPAAPQQAQQPGRQPATPHEAAIRDRFPEGRHDTSEGRWPSNYVEWVEVLYQDAAGQRWSLVMRVTPTPAGLTMTITSQTRL